MYKLFYVPNEFIVLKTTIYDAYTFQSSPINYETKTPTQPESTEKGQKVTSLILQQKNKYNLIYVNCEIVS